MSVTFIAEVATDHPASEAPDGFPPISIAPPPPSGDDHGDDYHDDDNSSHHYHSVQTITTTTSDGDDNTAAMTTSSAEDTSTLVSTTSQDISISTVTIHASRTGPQIAGGTAGSSEAVDNPIQTADPILETKASSNGLTTAGIVLASVFGVAAVLTIFYLMFRCGILRREVRKRDQQFQSHSSALQNENTLEKGIIELGGHTGRPQENGVIFPSSGQPSTRAWFSSLDRTWYPTDSLSTAAHSQRTKSVAISNGSSSGSSRRRNETPLQTRNTIFGLGLGRLTPLRNWRENHSRSWFSSRTSHATTTYNTDPVPAPLPDDVSHDERYIVRTDRISVFSETSHSVPDLYAYPPASLMRVSSNITERHRSSSIPSASSSSSSSSSTSIPVKQLLRPPPPTLIRNTSVSGSGHARMLAHHAFTGPHPGNRVSAGLSSVAHSRTPSSASGPGPTARSSVVSVSSVESGASIRRSRTLSSVSSQSKESCLTVMPVRNFSRRNTGVSQRSNQ